MTDATKEMFHFLFYHYSWHLQFLCYWALSKNFQVIFQFYLKENGWFIK